MNLDDLTRRLRALLDECEEDANGRVVLGEHASMPDVRIVQMELDVLTRAPRSGTANGWWFGLLDAADVEATYPGYSRVPGTAAVQTAGGVVVKFPPASDEMQGQFVVAQMVAYAGPEGQDLIPHCRSWVASSRCSVSAGIGINFMLYE